VVVNVFVRARAFLFDKATMDYAGSSAVMQEGTVGKQHDSIEKFGGGSERAIVAN
jgi:hypothetical protein